MDKQEIIKNIALRTGGDIYLGVVGAVRTGKSTFIKKVLENLIIPNISDEFEKKRALDETPQSSGGKTIMTIEPKFVPNNVAKVKIDDLECNMRLVDCVGYVIDNAKGYEDENGPRMVKTPWYTDEIPFVEAAEIGTEKVIKDHSTIGIIVTTDGSIGEFNRNDYVKAEEKVVQELKSINKPFIIVLNSTTPNSNEVCEGKVELPRWIGILKKEHYVKKAYIESIKESVVEVDKLRDVESITGHFKDNEYISNAYMSKVEPSTGTVIVKLEASDELFTNVLNEMFQDYKESKEEYEQIKTALKMVKTTGYGVANPTLSDMKLDTPEITKQGSRYGIKLKATAPSIHMIRVDVESTFEPIIGIEMQSKELIDYLMKGSETDPKNIWNSEIFGRSLDVIVQEGIQSKIAMMPENIRYKIQQTMSKVVNKGSNNLIAIVI